MNESQIFAMSDTDIIDAIKKSALLHDAVNDAITGRAADLNTLVERICCFSASNFSSFIEACPQVKGLFTTAYKAGHTASNAMLIQINIHQGMNLVKPDSSKLNYDYNTE